MESPEDAPSPDYAALRAWEAGMDRGTRQRGAQYAAEGRVKVLGIIPERIAGIVSGTESMPYRTTLDYMPRAHRWNSHCDCPVGIGCKHAVALALTVLAEHAKDLPGEESSSPAPSDAPSSGDFVQEACEALGRDLTRKETLALRALADACRPTAHGRPVRASIEAALHAMIGNDYSTLNRLPAELEGSATTPGMLLAAVAAALDGLGKAAPAWVGELLVRIGTADTFERERSARAVREWCATLGGIDRSAPEPEVAGAATGDFRLRRTGAHRFQWEMREAPDKPWKALPSERRDEFIRATFEADAMLAPEALGAFEQFRRFARSSTKAISFDVRELPPGKSFGAMLRHPAMRGRLAEEDGSPFALLKEPLVGSFAPSRVKRNHACPYLSDTDGNVPSEPPLPLGDGLFLTPEGLRRGPAAIGGYEGKGSPPDIPAAVFEEPSVRSALKASGAKLPETFTPSFMPLNALVSVKTQAVNEHSETVKAVATLSAVDSRERIRAILTDGVWRERPFPGETPDLVGIDPARRHFFQGPRHLGFPGTAFLGAETITAFADWLSGFPAGTQYDLPEELEGLVRPADRALLAAELSEDKAGRDWFDLKLVMRPEDTELTREEIKLLTAASGGWVRLPGKGWRRLEAVLTGEARDALASLGLDSDRVALGETHRYHAAQLAGPKADVLFDAVSTDNLRKRAAKLVEAAEPALPQGLVATLRPYQREGFRFLAHLASNHLGGVLADDMGLGKTLQTLAWLLWIGETHAASPGEPLRFLVVAPKSVVGNWTAETARFAPGLKVAVYGTDPYEKVSEADLVVTSYARLRLATESLLDTEWTAVVLDEGQHIKTPTSQISEIARSLKARHRLILSGTPVENRLTDLWSLFAFAMPGLLGTQASFKRHYDEKKDPRAASRLAARVRPFLLRRTKSQVATDLPERIEEDLVVELEPKQRKLYDAELKKVRAMLLAAKTGKDFDRERFHILSSLLRLRQICCDPRLISPKAKPEDSAKLDALWELLQPLLEEGHKVLVFSQFTGVLDLLAEFLKEKETPYLMLTGATENRSELVERFQKPDTEKVFLLSLKAAGTGLNLTAASYVVLFDPWWNPAAEAQAIDRTHRIGQKNRVIAYRLLAKNTVEEKIRALQRDKAALADEILREESLASVLDLDALRSILAD